jgi:phage-related minor tail protein
VEAIAQVDRVMAENRVRRETEREERESTRAGSGDTGATGVENREAEVDVRTMGEAPEDNAQCADAGGGVMTEGQVAEAFLLRGVAEEAAAMHAGDGAFCQLGRRL